MYNCGATGSHFGVCHARRRSRYTKRPIHERIPRFHGLAPYFGSSGSGPGPGSGSSSGSGSSGSDGSSVRCDSLALAGVAIGLFGCGSGSGAPAVDNDQTTVNGTEAPATLSLANVVGLWPGYPSTVAHNIYMSSS
jgi:hypothetical protein